MEKTINNSESSLDVPKKQINLICVGLLFSLFYWIMESVRDVVGLGKGSFLDRMFHPDALSFWMRILVVFLLVGFGAIAHSLIGRVEQDQKKPTDRFRVGGMIWAGLSFSAFYWVLESSRDVLTFGKGSFFNCLLMPDPIDIAMRLMAICVLLLFAAYAQILIDDRQRVEQTLKETQEKLEELVEERAEELLKSNKLLKQEVNERVNAEQELLKVNRALKILSECNEALIRATDETVLLNNICEKIVNIGGYPLVWVDLVRNNGKCNFESKGQATSHPSDQEIIIWFHDKKKIKQTPVYQAIKSNEPIIIEDISLLPIESSYKQMLLEKGFCAWISIPLLREQTVFGVLNIFGHKNSPIHEQEIVLLKDLANDMAFGITALKTRNEHEKIEQEKEQIRAQLLQSQKMEAVGILAGGVAHDFNNLLTAIQVSVDLAMMEAEENSPIHCELNEIHQVAMHASDVARQLLLFSRKHPMEPNALDLNDLVKHLQKMLIRVIGEKITIHNEFNNELWHVWADRGTLEMVLMNLVVNARDAMQDGGDLVIRTENIRLNKTICKQIPESRPGKYVKLTVEDTGIGMSKEVLNHVFEPFYSTKSPGKGTGLGLSVVYGIIKEHEGFLNVNSHVGDGTVFQIYLPAIYIRPELKENKPISLKAYQGEGRRILIVEDEDIVREFTCKGLQMNGYEVVSANNGSEAEQMFDKESGEFDVIFSDVVLPDITGIALSERLKKKKTELKILLCSGYADEQNRSPDFQGNGFMYLQKPYTLTDILRKLQTLINA
ncbi:ATP-binding protein [bacterium]